MKKTFSVNWQFKEQNFNAIDQVPEIKNPVLIICPECEMDCMVEIANYLLDNIKGSTPADIKNAGHFSNMERPKRFNEIILAFLTDNKTKS